MRFYQIRNRSQSPCYLVGSVFFARVGEVLPRCMPRRQQPLLCSCDRERRKSQSQSMARSVSRESVRSGQPHLPPPAAPLLLTTSPSSRIIRQSSQPEASCCHHHYAHAQTASASLRQLREPGDGIAVIAADSLRINGAIRQFKQVSLDLNIISTQ
ncbi:hypothetical protein LSTR_LSTR016295 [Laodelphax striatellus]|uniref:Uncharacterized protein n=1 Tax=Laodelphax striatellus TaxID=195883 RepID=A0A482WIV0_LAOST|nr:hypothetical protein LSTR_LSTR016295 [Laodelphax striatellus]